VVDPTARIGALCVVSAARGSARTPCSSRRVRRRELRDRRALHHASGRGDRRRRLRLRAQCGALGKDRAAGRVRIGNDVEIGANTCIDRGALRTP
jgi:UDP-3-O-[3-hydroxymyristoyl] glucosamine N-acyltransferase